MLGNDESMLIRINPVNKDITTKNIPFVKRRLNAIEKIINAIGPNIENEETPVGVTFK
jgi:hypothetical protein